MMDLSTLTLWELLKLDNDINIEIISRIWWAIPIVLIYAYIRVKRWRNKN